MTRLKDCLKTLALIFVFSLYSTIEVAGEEEESDATREQIDFFEKKIRPLLVTHCFECHSAGSKKLQAGLRLDYREGLIEGGESGAAIVPGDPDASLLIKSVRYESYEMPPAGKIAEEEIGSLVEWVKQGAPWPDEPMPERAKKNIEGFDLAARKAAHWAWKPIRDIDPPPPPLESDESIEPIDLFIFEKLRRAGLQTAGSIDRYGLARRLYFDLVGLPPDPDRVDAYVVDDSPWATEKLVDELIASPNFGERWGRHWLDLVRYSESRGHEFDHDAVNAYEYRDYVIRGLNSDVPYDLWVAEHLAGDLLLDPRIDDATGINESVLGTGFWFLGEWVHSPVDTRKDEADRFDNMIDVMSKTFLGLTVACARCHDHKFDPITSADYYALSGFLQSSDFAQVRFESMISEQAAASRLQEVDRQHLAELAELIVESFSGDAESLPLHDRLNGDLAAGKARLNGPVEAASKVEDGTVVLVDYSNMEPGYFRQNGFIYGNRPVRAGQIIHATEGDAEVGRKIRLANQFAAYTDQFWDGLRSLSQGGQQHRGRLAGISSAGRTLRTPTIHLNHGIVQARVRGRGHMIACVDSHRLVLGPLHNETVIHVDRPDAWHWVQMNLSRYNGHDIHFEFVPDDKSAFDVAIVVENPGHAWLTKYDESEAAMATEVLRFQDKINHWLESDSPGSRKAQRLLASWSESRKEIRKAVRDESQVAMAMVDGTGFEDSISIRGNPGNRGDTVRRRFLSAIDGDSPLAIATGSGRLELANRLNDPSNPFAHRVIVNRIWHHLMGRGIVASVDDFGMLGQPPTHPELLDYLVQQFLLDGRSIKRTIRRIVLSRTYQMSGDVQETSVTADANNDLWHHREPKRLDGESIRDSLLAVSGVIDNAMFGEPIPIHLTGFMEGRGRPGQSGPLDGAGRRTIYIAVRRNFLSPFMLVFDTPVPFSTMGRRNVSNVPAQALILMNDPFVSEQALKFGQRILAEVPDPTSEMPADLTRARVRRMYRLAFGRPPTDHEVAAAEEFLESPDSQAVDVVTRWGDLAHALFNTKEFIFLR